MIEMFYLVLTTYVDRSAVIVPEKYTLEQCEKAGRAFESTPNYHYKCIPAPVSNKVMCMTYIPNTGIAIPTECNLPTCKPSSNGAAAICE